MVLYQYIADSVIPHLLGITSRMNSVKKCEVGTAVDGYRDKCFNQDYSFNIDQRQITYMHYARAG